MVEIVGTEMTMHFSPKDLVLNAGFRDCFRTVRPQFMDYFQVVQS